MQSINQINKIEFYIMPGQHNKQGRQLMEMELKWFLSSMTSTRDLVDKCSTVNAMKIGAAKNEGLTWF